MPAFSQQELSYEQFQKVKEVIKASPQMEFTEGYATKLNINSVSDDHWKMIISNPNYTQEQNLTGAFELIDLANATSVKVWDTTLTVFVSDLSLAWETREGAPVEDPRFRIPTYEVGTKKIIKSYTLAGDTEKTQEQSEVLAENASTTTQEGSSVSTNSTSSTTAASDSVKTPELVRKDNLGKRDVLSFYNPATGMYEVAYDGRRSRWPYRDDMSWKTRNGFYDGGYGLMPVASTFYPSYNYGFPMGGGGWGAGFGGGCYGGGFSAGFSLDFGWTSGCSYANPYYMMPNRYSSGGAAIWNGYTHVGIDWIGSGVGWSAGGSNGYWYDDGCGGCKSNQVASADTYVSEADNSYYAETSGGAKSLPNAQQQQEEVFTSVGVSKFLANEDVAKAAPARENNQSKAAPVTTENRMSDIPTTRSAQGEASSRTTDRTEAHAEVGNRFQDVAPTRKAPAPTAMIEEKPRNSSNSSLRGSQDVKPGRHNPAISQGGRSGNTARDTRNTSARAQQDPKPGRTRNASVTPSTNHRTTTAPPQTTRRSNPAPHIGQKPMNNGGGRTVSAPAGQNRGPVTRPTRTQRSNSSVGGKQPMRSAPVRQANPQMRQKPMRSAPAPRVRKGR